MEKGVEHNKENCVKWLADIGASTSGSKQELTIRINRLSRYPGLVQKLKAKSEKAYVFPCSLISLKFRQPQPNGGQLATIFPGSMVKCSLSMFQRNERVVLVSKRKRYKCSQC